jgi:hypothetical protein
MGGEKFEQKENEKKKLRRMQQQKKIIITQKIHYISFALVGDIIFTIFYK